MLRDEQGNPVSRSGKPLYNLQEVDKSITDAEIFCKDWETSVSLVRTIDSIPVPEEYIYSIYPTDLRILIGYLENPDAEQIKHMLSMAVEKGVEGLVLRQGSTWLKVKPKETYDVVVTGIIEGTGRNKGRMGAIVTDMGNVSAGFTDASRQEIWNSFHKINGLKGEVIEVDCMSLTKNGKFRHPRFIRQRWDK